MAQRVLDRLKDVFGAKILETASPSGDEVAVVARDDWPTIAKFLRDDPACAMDMFIDLTCADFPERQERLEVWLRLYSMRHRHRICLKTRVSAEDPKVPSLYEVWRGIDWFEREAFDLFGVVFSGHPDLRRILLYEGFEGHPLRKDYAAEKTQPLVGYRDVPPTKAPPFGPAEGMPWSRR